MNKIVFTPKILGYFGDVKSGLWQNIGTSISQLLAITKIVSILVLPYLLMSVKSCPKCTPPTQKAIRISLLAIIFIMSLLERPSTIALLDDVKGLDIVDLGCGSGIYAQWFIDQGANKVTYRPVSRYGWPSGTRKTNPQCIAYAQDAVFLVYLRKLITALISSCAHWYCITLKI